MQTDTEKLAAVIDKLSTKDREFAQSMLDQATRKPLSGKQLDWVRRLTLRASEPPLSPISADMSNVVALFEQPRSRLRYPRLRMRAGAMKLTISVAGSRSLHPGSLNVIGERQDEAEKQPWYGRIHLDGSFEPSLHLTAADRTRIETALTALAADPAGIAIKYGKKTGTCCMCGLPLTDPRSVEVGYGGTCAINWGLPWGTRT